MITSMSIRPRSRMPGLTTCAMTVLVFGAWGDGLAQDSTATRPALRVGPTLESRAVTARSLLRDSGRDSPSVYLRYGAYERDFARAFGFPVIGPAYADEESFWSALERRLDHRWGDSTVFSWVERGLLLYARFQASTRFENRGFNMDLDVDDAAQGKFGVRVSRSFDQQ